LRVTPNGGELGAYVQRAKTHGPLDVEFPFGCGIVEQHNRLDDSQNPKSVVQREVKAVWGTFNIRIRQPIDIETTTVPPKQLKHITDIALLGFAGEVCDKCRVVNCALNQTGKQALESSNKLGYYEFEI
jgi:hypothetical protein